MNKKIFILNFLLVILLINFISAIELNPLTTQMGGEIVGNALPYVVVPSLFYGGAVENILSAGSKEYEKNKGNIIKTIVNTPTTYVKENPGEAIALATIGASKSINFVKNLKLNSYSNPLSGGYSLNPTGYYPALKKMEEELKSQRSKK